MILYFGRERGSLVCVRPELSLRHVNLLLHFVESLTDKA